MKHLKEFMKLKSYMKQFDNKKEWIKKISVFSKILIYIYIQRLLHESYQL